MQLMRRVVRQSHRGCVSAGLMMLLSSLILTTGCSDASPRASALTEFAGIEESELQILECDPWGERYAHLLFRRGAHCRGAIGEGYVALNTTPAGKVYRVYRAWQVETEIRWNALRDSVHGALVNDGENRLTAVRESFPISSESWCLTDGFLDYQTVPRVVEDGYNIQHFELRVEVIDCTVISCPQCENDSA